MIGNRHPFQIMKVHLLTLPVCFALLCICAYSQTTKSRLAERFEILSSDDLHVTSEKNCTRSVFLTVFVSPDNASQKNLEKFSERIGNRYPSDNAITIVFLVNRNLAKRIFDSEVENAVGRSIRGIYGRETGLKYYPSGMSERDRDVEGGNAEKK